MGPGRSFLVTVVETKMYDIHLHKILGPQFRYPEQPQK